MVWSFGRINFRAASFFVELNFNSTKNEENRVSFSCARSRTPVETTVGRLFFPSLFFPFLPVGKERRPAVVSTSASEWTPLRSSLRCFALRVGENVTANLIEAVLSLDDFVVKALLPLKGDVVASIVFMGDTAFETVYDATERRAIEPE